MHKLKPEVIDGLRGLTARGYINALENDCFKLTDKGKKILWGQLRMKITKELWAALDEIDGKTIVQDAELENAQVEYRWQAENHPKPECRDIFKGASKRTFLTRKEARLIASLGHGVSFEHGK